MRFNRAVLAALVVIAGLAAGGARAQQTQPGWIADTRTGCKVWNNVPQPNETISWSGACANGLAQGSGTLQWFGAGKPTEKYVGEYRGGKSHGRGVYTWASGDRYDGEYRDGKQHGRGVYTWASGDRYDGEYRDGKPNGAGTYYSASSGQTYSGEWTNGCFRQGDRWATAGPTKEECGFK